MGLITSSSRTEGKYRLFKTEAIARLAFIKTLQRLGLSLQEILEVLTVYDGGQLPCDDIKQKLEAQLVEIDLHLIEIMALRQKVSGLLASWQIDVDALKSNGNLTRSAEISHFTSKFIPLKIYK
jgi:MerR family copper efflux transcriptional regulator